jgi:hypothetical protein
MFLIGSFNTHYILCKNVENFKNKIKFKKQSFAKKRQNRWNIQEYSNFGHEIFKMNQLINYIKQKCVESGLVQWY